LNPEERAAVTDHLWKVAEAEITASEPEALSRCGDNE
jgi:hypothetical protein